MDINNKINAKLILQMSPEELMDYFSEEIKFEAIEDIDNAKNRMAVCEQMNKATAYSCYFKEMEQRAKLAKRAKKRAGGSTEEVERLLGIEEVFATYKSICEKNYDAIIKKMTLKRLAIDEMKILKDAV